MKKTLYLVRHAKSSWEDSSLADRDRPLAKRGERDAARMRNRLAGRGVCPDLILTSPAKRARATARIFARGLHYPRKAIVVDERLYPGRLDRLRALLGGLDARYSEVMLVGHDPALLSFARRFSNTIARLPTSAVAAFTFDTTEWSALGPARLRRVVFDAFR